MFATRVLRGAQKVDSVQSLVKKIVNKAIVLDSPLPPAPARGFAVRGVDGVVIPVKSEAEYIQAVSTDPLLKTKIFAGAGMEHYNPSKFNNDTFKHLGIATVFAFIAAIWYKVHNNAMMRDYRADYPKFDYIAEKAREAAAERKAAAAAVAVDEE